MTDARTRQSVEHTMNIETRQQFLKNQIMLKKHKPTTTIFKDAGPKNILLLFI